MYKYRQLSLDYFKTEENLKFLCFLGKFCSYKERLFSMILKQMLDVCYDADDEGSLTESKIMCIMFVCSDLTDLCSFIN